MTPAALLPRIWPPNRSLMPQRTLITVMLERKMQAAAAAQEVMRC
jgi:hypothetical protein